MSCVCLILYFFFSGLHWTSLPYWLIVKNVHLLFCNPDLILLGEDGPSQMGLEDLCMFRAIPNATVFYPSDAVATEKAVEIAANTKVCITVFLSQKYFFFFTSFVASGMFLACLYPHKFFQRLQRGSGMFSLHRKVADIDILSRLLQNEESGMLWARFGEM